MTATESSITAELQESGHTGIRVEGLVKRYAKGAATVLGGVDLQIEPGELVCLLGPSGSGKTTLLRAIAGLDTPDGGRITIGDQVVFDRAKKILVAPEFRNLGMVFQSYALWPHMTIEQNIAYPLKRAGVDRAARKERVAAIAEFMNLTIPRDRYPAQLSGGQQQRVALARALVTDPKALLLDEPLSNLDAGLRARLRKDIRALHDRVGMTTVLVTHDQEEARVMADRVAVLHEGQIAEVGTPAEILDRPRLLSTAQFVGFDNLLAAEVIDADGVKVRLVVGGARTELTVPSSARKAAGESVTFGVRAENVKLSASGIPGVVAAVTPMQYFTEVDVECADLRVRLRQPTAELPADLAPGARVHVAPDLVRAVVL